MVSKDSSWKNKIINEMDNRGASVNVAQVTTVKSAYEKLRAITSGSGTTVQIKLHKPFKSSGAVIAKGRRIEINDTAAFVEIAKSAFVFDVYSDVSGNVIATFSYDRLTKE